MITKVMSVNENMVVVSFDNRADMVVTSDNGSAWDIADRLLSPRHDMTRTQYFAILEAEDEVTEIVAVEFAA
jgi:hypothetical protein